MRVASRHESMPCLALCAPMLQGRQRAAGPECTALERRAIPPLVERSRLSAIALARSQPVDATASFTLRNLRTCRDALGVPAVWDPALLEHFLAELQRLEAERAIPPPEDTDLSPTVSRKQLLDDRQRAVPSPGGRSRSAAWRNGARAASGCCGARASLPPRTRVASLAAPGWPLSLRIHHHLGAHHLRLHSRLATRTVDSNDGGHARSPFNCQPRSSPAERLCGPSGAASEQPSLSLAACCAMPSGSKTTATANLESTTFRPVPPMRVGRSSRKIQRRIARGEHIGKLLERLGAARPLVFSHIRMMPFFQL